MAKFVEQIEAYGVVDVRVEETGSAGWRLRVYGHDDGTLAPREEPPGAEYLRFAPTERQQQIAAHPPLVKATYSGEQPTAEDGASTPTKPKPNNAIFTAARKQARRFI